MLDPLHDRAVLLDLLRASDGRPIDRIIGMTYTLDLPALIGASLALTPFDWEDTEDRPSDRLAALVAVQRAVGAQDPNPSKCPRLLIACHAGAVHKPKGFPVLSPWLEQLVIPVLPPTTGGIFHPKLWLVRWRERDETVCWRAIIASRNCTLDSRLDTATVLVGHADGNRPLSSRSLSDLVKAIPDLVQPGYHMREAVRAQISEDANELSNFYFTLPDDDNPVTISVHGLSSVARPHPLVESMASSDADRILAVAPFLDKGFIDSLGAPRSKTSFVSITHTLNGLAEFLESRPCSVLRGGGIDTPEPVPGDGIAIPPEADGLHAKIFVVERGGHAWLVMGSPNATTAAWGRSADGRSLAPHLAANVELSVTMDGAKSRWGIDGFLGDKQHGFGLLLESYHPHPLDPGDRAKIRMERALAQVLAQIVAIGSSATWTEEHVGFTCQCRLNSAVSLASGMTVDLCPLSLADSDRWVPLAIDGSSMSWSDLAIHQISAWWCLRLSCQVNNDLVRWDRLIQVPVAEVLTDRRIRHALFSLVTNEHDLMSLFSTMLSAESEGDSRRTRRPDLHSGSTTTTLTTSLEDLLRIAADEKSDSLQGIHDLIANISASTGTQLSPEFTVAWMAIACAKGLIRA